MTNLPTTQDTAERFAKEVQKHMINTGEKALDLAMDAVRAFRYPGADKDRLNDVLIMNSCEQKQKETGQSVKNTYVNTGQLDLFGHRGFDVPEKINGKDWKESTLGESGRALQAAQQTAAMNAAEHRRLMEKYDGESRYLETQLLALAELMQIAEAAGYDPETLTYAQAKEKGLERAA